MFDHFMTEHKVYAKKEVILSAGALQSPKILMLSGIGPKEQLDRHKIISVAERRGVGRNLMDHVSVAGMVFLVNTTEALLQTDTVTTINIARWFAGREGPLSSGWTEAIGFVNTKYGADYPWPDFQLVFVIASLLSDDGFVFRRAYGMSDELWAVYKPYIHRHSVLIFPVMLQPRSRGSVKLASWNPHDYPLIDANYFGNEYVFQ